MSDPCPECQGMARGCPVCDDTGATTPTWLKKLMLSGPERKDEKCDTK